MTRPSDKHLDDAELDALVLQSPDQGPGADWLTKSVLAEVQRHIASCRDCALKVQMHESAQSEIARLSGPVDTAPGPECVAEVEWFKVAAGLLAETKTRELMKHAAQCGHCGPLLKRATETLSDEVTSKEEQILTSLNSSRPEWQKNMARSLRDKLRDRWQKPWRRRVFAWPTPGYAFAGIAAVAILAWIGVRALRPVYAEQLLAQAYSAHRTLEVRIPGAKYAPIQVERGTGQSDFEKPQSLLRAQALISENLRKNPNDPAWLQARGRAELLDGNYEAALKSLQHALEIQPDSPGLLADVGSAYFLRAEVADRPIDYGNAIEMLSKALAKSPDDPIALFNRALACERMFLYAQAVDDWEHYLRIDPRGEWSEEARTRLAALKQRVEQHEKSQSEPLLTPAEVAREAGGPAIRAKIEERIEEYLDIAVIDWLPKGYPALTSARRLTGEYRVSLGVLATIAGTSHGDMWLSGLLSKTGEPSFPSAVLALASSVRSGHRGDYSEQRDAARRAAFLFRAAGNRAGEVRAKAEEVYADHLLYEGQACMSVVRNLYPQVERNGYTWLQTEMSLEKKNCAGLIGDRATDEAALTKALSLAKEHAFLTLYLRGLGFESDGSASMGDATKAFALASEGLRIFWSFPIQAMEGYNFYTDLDTAADNLRLPNLQVALWKQATIVIDRNPDVLQRAMAHRWYGNAAYLADVPSLAEEEFAKASNLFSTAPKTAATTRDQMDAEIWLARIETRRGDVEQASARLQRIQPILDGVPSFAPEIGYYSTLAEISMRRSDFSAAESPLRFAIFLAEWALKSFPSDTERRQWAEQTQDTYRDLVSWKLRQRDFTAALELWEWYKGAQLRDNPRPDSPPLEGLESLAPPDVHGAPPLPEPTRVSDQLSLLSSETVIAYAAFPDGIAIWSYDDRGIASEWIEKPLSQVKELSSRFREICSDPASDLFVLHATARSLYDLLIAPIEEHIGPGRTLVFEPDEVFAGIPFEALVDRTNHYLAQRNAVVISPGLYQASELRPTRAVTPNSPALVVSVPSPAEDGWVSLADAEREAQAVAGSFGSALWLKGSDASLAAIRRSLRGVAVFHFAGHAVATPERDGLMLAERAPHTRRARLLNAQSLSRPDTANLQLAVLSACQTDARPDAAESGNEGLAQALLHAGIPHVITSLWNVDSSQSATLMTRFYANLLSGGDVANSLRAAELALAAQPTSAHPYYWAAFELQGR